MRNERSTRNAHQELGLGVVNLFQVANPWYDSSFACPFETFSYKRQPYLQGYIIEPEKIRKFLNIQDPNDGRIDDVFCKILEALDLEEHPIHYHVRDGKTEVVLLLSPDAVANDIKTLEANSNLLVAVSRCFLYWTVHLAIRHVNKLSLPESTSLLTHGKATSAMGEKG
jgi:hypothetical protein